MEKYRKATVVEVISHSPEGVYVQNEGNPDDRWVVPNHIFDTTYEKVDPVFGDFGWAINQLKAGRKVARQGWNGKDMFIYLVNGTRVNYSDLRNEAALQLDAGLPRHRGKHIDVNSHIDMKAADGSIVIGWLASQTDMLATDWTIV